MSTLCSRCALRLQRFANASSPTTPLRSLSTTPTRKKALPTFQPTSNPELDDILSSFRSKHFIPRLLSNHDRNLILSMKTRKYLEENPQKVELGDEEIELQWIDQRTEIPNRVKILRKALRLMRDGEGSDWNNLPALLDGLHKVKKTPRDATLAKMIRLASEKGRFGIALRCLHQARKTGMTLKKEEVLQAVIWALRDIGRTTTKTEGDEDSWSKAGLEKAIKDANEVAMLLEDTEHGSGGIVHANDPRRRPEVLSLFLELTAVYAFKYQDREDVDGKVRAYAERLLANIKGAEAPATTEPAPTGPQTEMLRGISLWHGLRLAQSILGDEMPQAALARQVIAAWEEGLNTLASKIESGDVKKGSYAQQALAAWKDCVVV